MSSGLRYTVRGTKFAVEVGRASAKPITAVTKANPGVFSVAAHGYPVGQVLYVDASAGMPELAPGEYVVDTVPGAGTFTLKGVDTTNYSTFSANSPNTNTTAAITFSDFCELTGYNQQDGTADTIDATTVCSTAKEFEVGLSDSGTLALDYNFAPKSTVQQALRTAKAAGAQVAVRLLFPKAGGTVLMFGAVQSTSISGDVSGLHKGSASLKLSGDVVVLAA